MKNTFILLLLLSFISFNTQAQTSKAFVVAGYVYDDSTQLPIANHVVNIFTSGTMTTILTDQNGLYYDSAAANINSTVVIWTADCNGDTLGVFRNIGQATDSIGKIFYLCGSNNPPPCNANIVQSINGNTGTFTLSPNFGNQVAWDINGSSLSGASVTYTFPGPGMYGVCATVSTFACTFTVCDTVVINNNPPGSYDLWGNVYKAPASWAQSGLAVLYAVSNATGSITGIDTVTLDSGGYYFSGLNAGVYRVMAMLDPNDPDFLDYFPTYYGDVVDWMAASDIVVSMNTGADINLVAVPAAGPGGGQIVGTVVEGPNKNQGDPIENILVHLRDVNGNELEYDLTDANGEFNFTSIAYDDYQVRLEIAGVQSPIETVSLNNTAGFAQVNFEYDTLGVRIVLGTSEEFLKANTKLYPNPANEVLYLDITNTELNSLEIDITDLSGRVLQSVSSEEEMVIINLNDLKSGLYFVNVKTAQGSFVKKFVKE